MKAIILFALLLTAFIMPGTLKAQYAIPNGSFETWTGTYQPADWMVVQGKPTQGHVIAYKEIDSNYVDSFGYYDTLHLERSAKDGSSFINMGMMDTTYPSIISQKFPMTGRPTYFSMNYAYFPETKANQFQIGFVFTKWNTSKNQEDTILAGDYNSTAGYFAEPWTTLLIAEDLTSLYNPNISGNPDSGLITINCCIQGSPNAATFLLIDELFLTDTMVTTGVKLPENDMTALSAYPNPFSEKANIQYNLTQNGQVSLNVYDIDGKQVASLVNGNETPGPHNTVFDGAGLNNGIYFYHLQSADGIKTGKLVLSR